MKKIIIINKIVFFKCLNIVFFFNLESKVPLRSPFTNLRIHAQPKVRLSENFDYLLMGKKFGKINHMEVAKEINFP